MYGWPHMLCVDEDVLLDEIVGDKAPGSAALMAAVCKVNSAKVNPFLCMA